MNLHTAPENAAWITRIAAAASRKIFDSPRLMNVHRATVVEAIVDEALGAEWKWCSADYAAWDFIRNDEVTLEVKQSAARQSWGASDAPPSRSSFDIRERNGRHDGARWIDRRCRWAQIYVFAHHPGVDDAVDHRLPSQWDFYVVAATQLPAQKTIGVSAVRNLAVRCGFNELSTVVDTVASTLNVGT